MLFLTTRSGARFHAIVGAYRTAIKRDAVEIRAAKAELRLLQREGSDEAPVRQSRLAWRRAEARARLIAYGIHRGVALERLEAGRARLDELPYPVPGLVRRAVEDAEAEPKAPAPDS
jgi:hypothetical protein